MISDFDFSRHVGLSEEEAARRLREEGLNELPTAKARSVWAIAIAVAQEPMFLLLIACGVLYLVLGDVEEACMLLGFVFVILGITFYQERKTERALEALRNLSSPRARVIRDGKEHRVAGRDVARGDLLLLAEGDRVPADGVLYGCVNMMVDESLLTGESAPVRKLAAEDETTAMGKPGGEDIPFVYSGTMVVQGQGLARVLGTGVATEIGRVGKAIQNIEEEKTSLQAEMGTIVKRFAAIGAVLCVAVVVIFGLTKGNWVGGVLSGLTLAMAMLPEEFPVVLTIFLALGAWRMSRRNVLTRRSHAIEALGAASVLCVDKTGTLTENQMKVVQLAVGTEVFDPERDPANCERSENFHEILEYGILSSQTDPFDPMERAIKEFGETFLFGTDHLHKGWEMRREYPLSKQLLALSRVWARRDGTDLVVAAKGAPEAIMDLCHVDDARRAETEKMVGELSKHGLRVIGVAKASLPPEGSLPAGQHDFEFTLVGLIGLEDPVRATVPAAVAECHAAGVRVVMITGDYPGTAKNIAARVGLKRPDHIITGPELDAMSDDELARRAADANVFARVVPEQKLRIVKAFKALRAVVAMTGDGVNDAPALRAAHIGVAMGGRGTDVARESAALVLLDDDFNSIAQAVRMGRRIYDNIRKAMSYIFSIHVPIAGLSLIPILLKWDMVLLPVHIVFLELVIDPACSVAFEAQGDEDDIMRRKPRDPSAKLFGLGTMLYALIQGVTVLGIVLLVYVGSSWFRGESLPDEARTLAFTTLVFANIGLILTNISRSRSFISAIGGGNKALLFVIGGTLVLLACALYAPFFRGLFKFSLLHPIDLCVCAIAGVLSILVFELVKLVQKYRAARE